MAEPSGTWSRYSRWGTLPEKLVGPGRLHLWPSPSHTLAKIYTHLRDSGWVCETTGDSSMVVHVDDDRLSDLFAALSGTLTKSEMENTRALFKPGADGLSVSDIPRARSLRQLSAFVRSGWLLDMLSEGRLTSHFQPIVKTDDPTEIYGQECLLRGIGADGGLIRAGPILEAAKACGVLFQADLAARLTAIREVARHGVESNLFINLTPVSIYDPELYLRSTIEAIDEAGLDRRKIVFEFTETEDAGDADYLRNIADYCREKGFRVALDDVGSSCSPLNLIHRVRPDFIKLDRQLIRGVHGNPYKAIVTQKVLEMAQELGVKSVAEGVETHEELSWVRDRGATFAQGYLLANPTNPPLRKIA